MGPSGLPRLLLLLAAPLLAAQAAVGVAAVAVDVVAVDLAAAEGPAVMEEARRRFALTLHNRASRTVAGTVELELPPGFAAHGAPRGEVELEAGERRRFHLEVEAPPWWPAALAVFAATFRPVAADLPASRASLPVRVALGCDFLRLCFEREEGGDWTLELPGFEGTGQWTAARKEGAPRGRFHLEVSDGGGNGFGRRVLFGAPGPGGEGGGRVDHSFSVESFPWLTFWFRASGPAPVALNLELSCGAWASVPLVGPVRAAFGDRVLVPPAGFTPDGTFQRLAYDLRGALAHAMGEDPARRVARVDLGPPRAFAANRVLGGGAAVFALDEFAVSRRPEETEGDLLRSLADRHGRRRRAGRDLLLVGREALEEALEGIREDLLEPEERCDLDLLRHAAAWDRVRRELPPKAAGEPAGRERLEAMLRHLHHLDLGAEELALVGEREVALHLAKLRDLAPRVRPGAGIQEVVRLLEEDHPTAEELPELARASMEDAMRCTAAAGVVSLPPSLLHGRIRVVTSGPLSRTYPFGGYGGVARQDGRLVGTYIVSPPAEWMDEEQASQRLRGNHRAWTRVVALHEIIPGHHLQTATHMLLPLPPLRRATYSTLFAEGWALYCEELLWELGCFPDLDTRFTQLRMRLWRALRVVIDARLHTGAMAREEAEDLLVSVAGLQRENARAEVARYIDNPSRPMSYLMGYRMLMELRRDAMAAEGEGFSPRRFHDRVLSFGALPLPAIRRGMGL